MSDTDTALTAPKAMDWGGFYKLGSIFLSTLCLSLGYFLVWTRFSALKLSLSGAELFVVLLPVMLLALLILDYRVLKASLPVWFYAAVGLISTGFLGYHGMTLPQ